METTAHFSSRTLNPHRILPALSTCRKTPFRKIMASTRGTNNGGDHYQGKLVDESMIQLRMRIKEMKVFEKSDELPSNWMEWEKQYFLHYNEDICKAIGLLQNYLMNVRPSLALGMIALLMLSVPISTAPIEAPLVDGYWSHESSDENIRYLQGKHHTNWTVAQRSGKHRSWGGFVSSILNAQ
ncbi:PREDICTED: uncharacterized protein LOC18601947 [Theobroma cacao]|uniref:Uncharacterized protein LOC18601947 n=1 Tax=Theobroma cacao TaxID=3641 RepID=A0AB32V6X3_THECC|nr:PREDICTED: uncharacterized protein LOC18601947 [Theobroma cacao]